MSHWYLGTTGGYNRSEVQGTTLLLRGVLGRAHSERDEDPDSAAVA